MAKIVATRPILLANRIYEPGELLPAWDTARTAAWLEAGSAVLVDDDTTDVKADEDTAEVGNEPADGVSMAENGDAETDPAEDGEETPDTADDGDTTSDNEEDEAAETDPAEDNEETPDTAATPGDGKVKPNKGTRRKK